MTTAAPRPVPVFVRPPKLFFVGTTTRTGDLYCWSCAMQGNILGRDLRPGDACLSEPCDRCGQRLDCVR